ncbi:MAG: sigma-70 family RNA polymerase sigma factor [Chloroflexi bacterium]|uniref:Sigma-70 family RNA polymerase sigma factor n=1 Tax=Candidatus Chlorohelix allophototropha TaxID=3003348 RepID=A0A8T7M4M9_9CHLR|nr:sigma-70 family RNA polymerase sigma factor [Chloroflexota bacterium]WJW70360.1 sigma-70 family RNA polymerase sigma factor [Chloroflexota bacterium L227-S17]
MKNEDNLPGGGIVSQIEIYDSTSHNKILISQYLEEHSQKFEKTLCVLVWNRLGSGHDTKGIAGEILSEVTSIALSKAPDFDTSQHVEQWLYGIARNVVRQRFEKIVKLNKREVSVTTLAAKSAYQAEGDFFDQFTAMAIEDFAEASVIQLSFQPIFEKVLRTLSQPDQEILRLYLIKQLDGAEMASALGIGGGAARVRLSRALNRVRNAMIEQGWSQ